MQKKKRKKVIGSAIEFDLRTTLITDTFPLYFQVYYNQSNHSARLTLGRRYRNESIIEESILFWSEI